MRKSSLHPSTLVFLVLLSLLHCVRADSPRPASKDAKVGGVGKNYFVLPKTYLLKGGGRAIGFGGGFAIPAGIYRIKYEDNDGYYLAAPSPFLEKVGNTMLESSGGLYVAKKNNALYLYHSHPGTGKPVAPNLSSPALPRDLVAQLRQ